MPLTINPTLSAADNAAKRIRELNAELIGSMQACLTEAYNTFWFNSQGATPQEVADALGADAVPCFSYHAAVVAIIAEVCIRDGVTINTPTAIPAGWTMAVTDGQLVLTAPAIEPEG